MAEVDEDEKYLYGENNDDAKAGISELFEKKLNEVSSAALLTNITKVAPLEKNEEEDAKENTKESATNASINPIFVDNYYLFRAPFGAGVNWAAKGVAGAAKPSAGASGDTKRLDIDAVGTVNSVSIYEYDMDLGTDEKPWRDPGADITDYFNYGFTEDTWKQYCERQRRLRMEVNGQKKIYTLGQGTTTGDAAVNLKAGPPPDRKTEGTIDVIGGNNSHTTSRRPQDEQLIGFQPPELNFAGRPGFPRPFPGGPLQVAQPRLFPRHPNLPAGLRPPFMPPPMGAGFQIPVAPQSEPNANMSNPSVSGAPTSSATSQIPGSAPDGTVSSMAPPHVMIPQMGGPGGQLPPHMFGPEGLPPGMQLPPGMPGAADLYGRGPMDPFMPPNANVPGMFPQWDINALQGGDYSRSPERTERERGERGSDADSDSESRRHRRRDKDRHREHRDRDRESTRDKDRDKDRERRHRDRESRRDRDRDKDKDRSRTRDKDRSSRRSERSRDHKSDRRKHRSSSRQRDESEEGETPRKRSRKSRHSVEETAYQGDGQKEEGEATE
eukprot:gene125-9738_t